MKRIGLLDDLRGLTLISMIAYHGTWDIVNLFHKDWSWFNGFGGHVWQQSICITFILLSGFCWSMGHHRLRRALIVLGGGFLISFVTEVFMSSQSIRFGILTMLGSCMLLMILLEKVLKKIPDIIGVMGSLLFFCLLRDMNNGYLGFQWLRISKVPEICYTWGEIGNYLGFTEAGFRSADYFSLFPWSFLFITGYFLWWVCNRKGLLERMAEKRNLRSPLVFLGKNSLLIYLLHQPVMYGLLYLIMG